MTAAVSAEWPSARTVRAVARSTAVVAAAAQLDARAPEIRARALELGAVPAPSFHEQRRARWVAERLAEDGIPSRTDRVGNVIVERPGHVPGVLVTAHLDTVFAESDEHAPRAEGGRLVGRGIGDNTIGVVALMELARSLRSFALRRSVSLAATVCEEGRGDLRGARALADELGDRLLAGVAIEGHFYGRVVTTAVGSRRWRIGLTGPGGHSWHDRGGPSAVHAAARLASRLADVRLPRRPLTTLNVGRIGGGEGVNVLARDAWVELEVRSEQQGSLDRAAAMVEQVARDVAAAGGVDLSVEVVGDRPAGALPHRHALARAAVAALTESGSPARLDAASTEANALLARGIPAVSVGVTTGAGMHAPHEHVDEAPIAAGLRQLLYLVVALAGGAS